VKPNLVNVLHHLDVKALRELAKTLTEAGHTQDEVVEQVVAVVDALLPWDQMGPAGVAIDAIDGPVVTAFVKLLLHTKRK
jgi:hypothetical protein